MGGGIALYGLHTSATGSGPALRGESASTAASAFAIYGISTSSAQGAGSAAVRGQNNGTNANGYGIFGSQAGSGTGVYGQSPRGPGVRGKSTSSNGVEGVASAYGVSGVYGENLTGGYGIAGRANGSLAGALGDNLGDGPGVEGSSVSGTGVEGSSISGAGGHFSGPHTGMFAETLGPADSESSEGVLGESTHGSGVYGESGSGAGIYGFSAAGDAGYFFGSVVITNGVTIYGGCTGCTGPAVRIDDPIDPARKYLQHSQVASPEMLDLYNGIARTGTKGFATVRLPSYFQALNRSFRYQLTVIGKAHWDAQAVVWNEIARNRFTIRTDQPDVNVSWQVTGVRHDRYSTAHPAQVVVPKTGAARGKYLNPYLYGHPKADGIGYLKGPRLPRRPARQ